MHVGTSLDCRDDWDAYVGYVFQSLNTFVVNLAPDAGIGAVAKGGPIDICNELPSGTRKDYDLVRAVLRNPVEPIDKFRVRLRGHDARPTVGVKFGHQHPAGISCKLQTAICVEVVSFNWVHSNFLVVSSFDRMKVVNLPLANHTVKFRNSLRVSAGSRRIV